MADAGGAAAAQAGSRRRGRGGGCAADSRRAAAGSAPPCTRGDRVAPPWRRAQRPRGPLRAPPVRRRLTAMTTAAGALVRFEFLKYNTCIALLS